MSGKQINNTTNPFSFYLQHNNRLLFSAPRFCIYWFRMIWLHYVFH